MFAWDGSAQALHPNAQCSHTGAAHHHEPHCNPPLRCCPPPPPRTPPSLPLGGTLALPTHCALLFRLGSP